MIRSMTGFGSAEVIEGGTSVKVEIHSVNGRFLDLKVKLPKYFYEYEGELRKIAQEHIDRGRVNVNMTVNMSSARAAAVRLDYDLAARYMELTNELAHRHSLECRMDARTLISLPDILAWDDEDTASAESQWEMARRAAVAAFEAHRAMREKEGEAIGHDVRHRLDNINLHLAEIEKRAPEVVRTNTARLRKKIESLIGSDTFDEVRFAMEVALYADRLDITEEIVRFRSHNKLFAQELLQPKTSGRKLSFLLQEMNRETNTIGSKVMDAEVAGVVVLIKEELEKMREQTENME
ncbi:MAG: YicC/YloC family endoribonuclease [Candidatus Latescibacterota bacterium]